MLRKIFLVTYLIVTLKLVFALGVSDFVPGYLVEDNNANSGADSTLPVKPLVNPTRSNTQISDNNRYCNNGSDINNNIFCDKSAAHSTESRVVFESSENADNIGGKMVDNSVGSNGRNISQPSANQQTMQDQQVRNAINRTQNGFSVPIQTGDDVKLNINQQQIQFNIQY